LPRERDADTRDTDTEEQNRESVFHNHSLNREQAFFQTLQLPAKAAFRYDRQVRRTQGPH
jgi:hypothetical protein